MSPGEPTSPGEEPARARRLAPMLCLLVLLVVAAYSYRAVFDLGHLGWDTWPMIASSRIESGANLLDTFREELMDGRYPLGRFYRPATNLSFAFDHARGGTSPRVFHQTDIAIVLAAALVLFLLARRLFDSGLVALCAAAFFVLHPLHFEALPVSARRADTQSVLFTLLAVWLAAGASRTARWRLVAAGFAALCAMGSKETGVLAVPLVFGVRFCAPPVDRTSSSGATSSTPAGLLARALAALRESAWVLGAIVLFVAARTLVLEGLGGHPDSSILGGLARFPSLAPAYGRDLLVPQPWSSLERGALAGVLGALLAVGAVLVLAAGRGADDGGHTGARRRETSLVFVLFWAACTLAITGISGETQTWYGVPMLVPYALLAGWVLGRGLELCLCRRLLALLGVAAAGTLLASHIAFSGLFHQYATWSVVDGAVSQFLGSCAQASERLRPGQRTQLRKLPLGLQTVPGEVGVRSAAGIEGYGVQAFFDLEHPERHVRVVALHRLPRGSRPDPPAADEIVLLVSP